MANGVTARLPLESPSAPAKARHQPEDKPERSIERRIGEITADSVLVLAQAVRDWGASGAMAACTRERTGELFLQLYQIQQAMMTDDFPALMHTHGKRVLWERNPEIFSCHPGTTIDKAVFDRGLDVMIDHLCVVLRQVTAIERVYAMARMN